MSFDEVAAQQPLVAERLRCSLRRGRLAHAYLFDGPPGSGRQAAACALVQALNCQRAEHDGCGKCDSCRRIAAGKHPDVYWVRPESKSRRITVAQIRELEKALSLKPLEARVKAGILVEADCMSEEASNAFLKTLEEPPGQTVLLLLTAEPQRLLPTILSRCLKMPFDRGERGSGPYRAVLAPVFEQLATARTARVPAAYGALAKLTAVLRDEQERIRADAERSRESWGELDAETRKKLEDQLAARLEGEYRGARAAVMEELSSWFRDVLLCVQGADPRFLVHRDSLPLLQAAAAGLSYAQAEAKLEALEGIHDALARNIAEVFALEVGLLKLVQEG